MRRRGLRRRVGALLAVALMSASACEVTPSGGANGDGSLSDARAAESVADLIDPHVRAPAPRVEGALNGGTVTVLSSTAPRTLDPTRAGVADSAILALVTRALTQYQYRNGEMALVPDLATDLGRHNKDFTEWRFTLRDGLKYEDGSNVTAADIAYAVKRQFAVEELPDGPTYGVDYYADGDKYLGPFKSTKRDKAGRYGGKYFKAVQAPDDKTLVLKMRKPFADLPYYAARPSFTPIPPGKDTKQNYAGHPMATGPYMFEAYTPGKELVLTRNESWDPATDTTRHQYPDRFVFRFDEDPVKLQERIIADEGLDQLAMTSDGVLAEMLPKITAARAKSRILRGPGRCVSTVFMDTTKIPLPVRKALATAYPIESTNDAAGIVPGLNWSPTTSLLPRSTLGRQKYDAVGTGGKGDGDPGQARKLLEEAGEEGFRLSYYYAADDPVAPKVSEIRKERLEDAGFTVRAVKTTAANQKKYENNPKSPVNLRFGDSCPDWPSGGSVFPAQWDERKVDRAGLVSNPAFLTADGQVSTRIDEISAYPAKKGLPEWGRLDKWIMKKYVPAIPTGEQTVTALHGSGIGNAHIDGSRGRPDYAQLFLLP